MKKLCALVIGHHCKSQGAVNTSSQTTEFNFNEALSQDIIAAVKNVDIIRVYRGRYRDLPEQINRLNPDFIISLHCNAFNRQTSGSETLYLKGSTKGQALAQALQNNLVSALRLPNRGIKAITGKARGGYLLRYTNAPCVIAEPFFIDNDSDLHTATQRINQLAQAYIKTIEHWGG